MDIRLNAYVPIWDKICADSKDQTHVYDIKFHGKPVSKLPRKNSNNEKTIENNKIKAIFFLAKGPIIKVVNPKNKDKNNGTNISGIITKFLNSSSWVSEIEIQ